MSKVKIVIEEELKYERAVIVDIPDVTSGTIDSLLTKAEENADDSYDIVHQLQRLGCTVIKSDSHDFDSPNYVNAEIIDYEILKDGNE